LLHGWPVVDRDREHHGVAEGAIFAGDVATEYAFAGGAQFRDRCLATGVEQVGLDLHAAVAEVLEGVGQEEQLGLGLTNVDQKRLSYSVQPRWADSRSV